ncbi:hypothetical protein [Paraburkholderia tagetis]|uniref:Uncharacterized protein n=1 Tax=Paraburkholderia tagetis TaxID=2913261 RepID=A0A9X1UFT5_9BURK|nr:hypothetical protein [Paraburkholderia tagetis]MCG5072293.1 hypothetical protein [Paraburkholderia tagetis]
MSVYVRIQSGIVAEIIAPMLDGSGVEIPIASRFYPLVAATLVDVTAYAVEPRPGWVATESSGAWAFSAPVPVALSGAQQAAVAFSAGIQIKSTATASLNGTYSIDTLSQSDIIAIETGLNAGKGFPDGSTMFNYPDASGIMHSFSEADFSNFAAAVRDYVYALRSAVAGISTSLPSPAATIP